MSFSDAFKKYLQDNNETELQLRLENNKKTEIELRLENFIISLKNTEVRESIFRQILSSKQSIDCTYELSNFEEFKTLERILIDAHACIDIDLAMYCAECDYGYDMGCSKHDKIYNNCVKKLAMEGIEIFTNYNSDLVFRIV